MATGRALSIERNEARKRKAQLAKPKPQPMVSGVSTTGLNPAQQGGARGIGFDQPTPEASDAIARASAAGVPMSALGDENPSGKTNLERPRSYSAPVLSSGQSASFLKSFGLSGMVDDEALTGLTATEANRRGMEERQRRMGQVSANTSFAFSPETITNTRKAVDRLNLSLTDINRDPFNSKGTKTDKVKAALDASAKEIAALFTNPQELREAQMFDTRLAQTLDTFTRLGGDITNIEDRIRTPQPGPSTMPETSVQSTGEYLASLRNPNVNPRAEQQAVDELIPERDLMQQEIARQARIPQQMMELYFGTEHQVGVLKQKENQAIERARILEEQERDEKNSLRTKAKIAIDRSRAELEIEKSKVEQNRLAARNYMTGMLAKLGALNTTGAAPAALQTLETQYQGRVTQLETAYRFDARSIEAGLDEALNTVENGTEEAILRLQEDLTKDYETVSKEIMKLEQASEKEIHGLSLRYATKLRERTTSHTATLKKEAEKNLKDYLSTVGAGIDLFSVHQLADGTFARSAKKNAITSSYQTVKNDIKKNLPADVATKIITELTDEQLSIFLEDYLSARVSRSQSIDPVSFYDTWKKQYAPEEEEDGEFKPVY